MTITSQPSYPEYIYPKPARDVSDRLRRRSSESTDVLVRARLSLRRDYPGRETDCFSVSRSPIDIGK